VVVSMLMVAAFLMGVGLQLCITNVITTRRMIAPQELIGRVTASFRSMACGTGPFGADARYHPGRARRAFPAVAGLLLCPSGRAGVAGPPTAALPEPEHTEEDGMRQDASAQEQLKEPRK
jgi:hypothetical protein